MKKLFHIFVFLYMATLTNAAWDDITFTPDKIAYYIVPTFSENSKPQDFLEIYNYFSSFLRIPEYFTVFTDKQPFQCYIASSETTFLILGSHECLTENDSMIINLSTLTEKMYEESVTTNVTKLLTKAYHYVEHQNSWSNGHDTLKIRANVIILTDLSVVQGFYDSVYIDLQEILFFILSSAKENHQENEYPAHQYEQYFYTSGSVSKESINQLITNETLTYRLSIKANKYNVFIVGDELILEYAINMAESLISQSDWGNLFPILYVAALKKNESFYYQTVAMHLINTQFSSEKLSTRYQKISTTLSTDLVERYLIKVYNVTYDNSFTFDLKWNLLITDTFPKWLTNTGLIFDSFSRHLDVYLITNDSTYKNILNDLSENINEIIVDDENSTQRNNHIILQNAAGTPDIKYFPTFKKQMLSQAYSYRTPTINNQNRWWIWLIVGCCLAAIGAACVIYWFCCYRKYLKTDDITRPFSPSTLSQIPETTTEKQKMLFIDETCLQVLVSKILGHGTSSLVYEGFLNDISPVVGLHLQMGTSNFVNCIVAVKAATTVNKYEFEQVFREIDAALKIGYHRHICCLLGWTLYHKIPTLILEHVNGTNLHAWIQSTAEETSDKIIAKILWQITDAMEHISARGIVHKDLAARNILLNEMLEVKVTDFGISSAVNEKQHIYQAPFHRRLPLRWMAIEAIKKRLFSEASDVWSFGVLIWEIYNNGDIPYGEMDGSDIIECLSAGNRLDVSKINIWKSLVIDCWKEERQERPAFTNIKKQFENFLVEEDIKYGYIKCLNQAKS